MAKKSKNSSENPFDKLVEATGNELATCVQNGVLGDTKWFVDTGSYVFNALLSGSIFGGLPGNRITALAGEPAAGKTYFVVGIIKNFLETYPNSRAYIFESESAISKQMLEERGVDISRVYIIPVATIEELRTQALKLLNAYDEMDTENRPKILLALDSLGMLSSNKEVEDSTTGKDKKDMTKPGLIKGTFRVLTLKCAKLDVPMIFTNHVYDVIGSYVPMKDMGGGYGLKFAASSIVFLTKKKMKSADKKKVIGGFIKCNMIKSRFTKEFSSGEVMLSFAKGLNRYYGLLELGLEQKVIKKEGYSFIFPDGQKGTKGDIYSNLPTFFNEENLKVLDKAAHDAFYFGSDDPDFDVEITDEVEDE